MTYSHEALAAIDALIASAFDGGESPDISEDVFEELEAAGDLDALAQLEEEVALDWADPDSFDTSLELWLDTGADPYDRGESFDIDEKCEFMLGSHRPSWLYPRRTKKNGQPYATGRDMKPNGTLFVSFRQLTRRESPYRKADTPFVVDSGGFSYLHDHGCFPFTAAEYVEKIRRVESELGTMRFACQMDWMCEEKALEKTGLTIAEHQRRTIANFVELRELAPEIKWLPALQGNTVAEYMSHIEQWLEAGIDLRKFERVGVGSVCRRQSTAEIVELIEAIADKGIRIHGLGVKSLGLARVADRIVSSDSLAWSYAARREGRDQNSQHEGESYRAKMEAIIDERDNAARWGV